MSFDASPRAGFGHPVSKVGARRVVTIAFAAQGVSVAAVYTTVPAVTERLGLAPLLTTTLMIAVALTAGAAASWGWPRSAVPVRWPRCAGPCWRRPPR